MWIWHKKISRNAFQNKEIRAFPLVFLRSLRAYLFCGSRWQSARFSGKRRSKTVCFFSMHSQSLKDRHKLYRILPDAYANPALGSMPANFPVESGQMHAAG